MRRAPLLVLLLGLGLIGCGGAARPGAEPSAVRTSNEGGDMEYSEGAVPVSAGTGAPPSSGAASVKDDADDDDDEDADDESAGAPPSAPTDAADAELDDDLGGEAR